jgi:hypothetical protein
MTVNVFPSTLPGEPLETHEAEGLTLEQWLIDNVPSFTPGAEQPISATVNGAVVEPEHWADTWIGRHTNVDIRPQPGDPGTMLIAAIVAGVVAAAAAFLLKPSIPNQNSKSTRGSSIYEANAKGNKPKLGDVIPEIAGRHKTYPDYLTAPRRYFIDPKTQALDLLLCVGKGEYVIPDSEIRIGSTPIRSLGTDVSYSIFSPGASVTGHIAHQNWYNAPEVGASTGSSGLRLKDGADYTQTLAADALTFDSNTIVVPTGAGTVPEDWDLGMLLQVNLLQDIDVTDGGQDADGVYLRDILEGEFPAFAEGDAITISGGSAIGGDYLVHSYTAGTPDQLTLNDTSAVPAAFLSPGLYTAAIDYTGVRYRIDDFVTEEYEVTTTNDDGTTTTTTETRNIGYVVTRLNPDGTVDSGWTGFVSQTTSDASVHLDTVNLDGGWSGPFLACPEGETTSRIEWDVFAPSGIGYINDDGNIEKRTRKVEIQYRAYGTDAWSSDVRSISGSTRDQLGWTFVTDLPASMTPEVRVRRIGAESNSTQALDRLEWYGLRSKLPHKTSYPGVTALAITLTGSDTIASQTENQVSVVATRRLGYKGGALEATRNIAPWVEYIAKSVGYREDEIDYDELDRLDAIWQGRGDFFDFVTDDDSTVKESLNRALRAGMAEFTIDAGRLRPVRDEPRTVHEHGYSPQNMSGPLKRSVQAPRPDDADGVDVEYFSAETWTQETVECRLPGDNGFKAEKLRIEGVTNRTKAWQIGMRERRRMKYRRWSYSFETELDALNSRYMSYVALLDDVPGYGQSALIEAIDGSVIRSSEPLEWTDGQSHVIAWRRPDGTLAGPYAATQGEDDYHVIADMDETPVIDRRGELPHLYFGTTDEWSFLALITDISPQGFESVSVEATNYDPRVYDDDNNAPA